PSRNPRTNRRRAGCAADGGHRTMPAAASAGPVVARKCDRRHFGASVPGAWCAADLLANVDRHPPLSARRHARRVAAALRERVEWRHAMLLFGVAATVRSQAEPPVGRKRCRRPTFCVPVRDLTVAATLNLQRATA